MHLITMAHLGEAQGIITLFKLKKINSQLFKGDELILAITGEGPFEASTLTASILGQGGVSKVINLGLAGALNNDLEIGEIYPIRMAYLLMGNKPQFKSFKSLESGLDCLTSFERITTLDEAAPLKGLASLVDREAWGVAMAAKSHSVTFECYKLVSDYAGSTDACEISRVNALDWSEKMALFLQSLLNAKPESNYTFPSPEGFHFTFSTQHQFQDLLNKLSLKEDSSDDEILSSLPLNDLRELKILPKERTRKLLQFMTDRLDPVAKNLNSLISEWQKPFESQGLSIRVDNTWEDSKVKISFEVESDEELKNKLTTLQNLSVRPYQDILEGRFNVE